MCVFDVEVGWFYEYGQQCVFCGVDEYFCGFVQEGDGQYDLDVGCVGYEEDVECGEYDGVCGVCDYDEVVLVEVICDCFCVQVEQQLGQELEDGVGGDEDW